MKLKKILWIAIPVFVLCVGLILFLALTAPRRVEADGVVTDNRIRTEGSSEDNTTYTLTLFNRTRNAATLGAPTFQYKDGEEWKDTGGTVSCPEEIRLNAFSSLNIPVRIEAGECTADDSAMLTVSSLQHLAATREYRLLFPAKDKKGDTFSVSVPITPIKDCGFICGVRFQKDGMTQNTFVTLRLEKTGSVQYKCTLENRTGIIIGIDEYFLSLQRKTETGWEELNPYPHVDFFYERSLFISPQGTYSNTIQIPNTPGEYRVIAEYGDACAAVYTLLIE